MSPLSDHVVNTIFTEEHAAVINTRISLEDSAVYTAPTWSPSVSITPAPNPAAINGQNAIGCVYNCNENSNIIYYGFIAGTLILTFGVVMCIKCASRET